MFSRVKFRPTGLLRFDVLRRLIGGVVLAGVVRLVGAEAVFLRGINLNGPALTIDGRAWEAGAEAPDFKATGKNFANQRVALKPPTDAARTQMIRSSVWGSKVDLELGNLAAGSYQVILYVWEDNHDEQFDLLVNGNVVVSQFHSGSAGMWALGPGRAGEERRRGNRRQQDASGNHGFPPWVLVMSVPEIRRYFSAAACRREEGRLPAASPFWPCRRTGWS
jgi:hypothetical protein